MELAPLALRQTLTTRITEKTRRCLERAVAESGRSLSQEIELRLELSLAREELLRDLGLTEDNF